MKNFLKNKRLPVKKALYDYDRVVNCFDDLAKRIGIKNIILLSLIVLLEEKHFGANCYWFWVCHEYFDRKILINFKEKKCNMDDIMEKIMDKKLSNSIQETNYTRNDDTFILEMRKYLLNRKVKNF